MNFDLNDYTRRVDVGFCRLKNPRNFTGFQTQSLDDRDFEIIYHGQQEISPYALRDT